MFIRKKRADTKVGSIEAKYGIDLHARSDMRLGRLLSERGFDSMSQLIRAYEEKLSYHARRRRVFLSYHAEDGERLEDFRKMVKDHDVEVDIYDLGLRTPINSKRSVYIKRKISAKIQSASVVLCLVGNGTGWREWVIWELETAIQLGKGMCAVRIPGSFGRIPALLARNNAPVARWNAPEIVAAIECAAARRS